MTSANASEDSNSQDYVVQIEIMKWQVERLEVANISLIARATSFAGFCMVELALLANLVSGHSLKTWSEKVAIISASALTATALCFFILTLLPKSFGDPYTNMDYADKNIVSIKNMLTALSVSGEHSEELLQDRENEFRSGKFGLALMCLLFSTLPLIYGLSSIAFNT